MRRLLQFTLDWFDTAGPAPTSAARPAPPVRAAQPPPAGPAAGIFQEKTDVPSVDGSLFAINKVVDGAALAWQHPRANRELLLGGVRVAYEFLRGQRRTIGFSVGPEGLVVRAPPWVPQHEVEAALHDKSAWILRKLGETRERQTRLEAARITCCDGALLPVLGQPLPLVLLPCQGLKKARAQRVEGVVHADTGVPGPALQVSLPQGAPPQLAREAVQRWLMQQAQAHFVRRLDHFAPQLGVRWTRLSLSSASTRWGSASTDGSIRLNWRLVHFEPPVVDYVVAHELSHLRVMDHSPRFWETVRTVVPDYAALRRQLRDAPAPRW
jgi:predicted metal-dependent hydrolase